MYTNKIHLFLMLSMMVTLSSYGQNTRPETGYPYTWEQLRTMDEFDYESRWDDLTLLRTPYWVTSEEFAGLFGFSRNIEIKEYENSSDIRYQIRDGRREFPLLSLKLIMYGVISKVRDEEREIIQNISTLGNTFYEQIPTGVKDLRAYHRKDRGWVYIFSENGISYFFLDYHKTMEESLQYLSDISTNDPKFEIARAFLEFLIKKYDPVL